MANGVKNTWQEYENRILECDRYVRIWKITNVIKKINRLGVNMLGICETRWHGMGQQHLGSECIKFSRNQDLQHRNGITIVIGKKLLNTINFIPF